MFGTSKIKLKLKDLSMDILILDITTIWEININFRVFQYKNC